MTCEGTKSCFNSNINEINNLWGYGAFSLSNSTVSVNAAANIYMLGYLAANGASFECPASSQCIAHCKVSGCFGATFSGNWSIVESEDETAKYQLVEPGAISNDQECTQTFDRYHSLSNGSTFVGDGGGSICCRGFYSCYMATSISTATNSPHSIVCSGRSSCFQVGLIRTYSDIVCSGYYACQLATIESFGDVHCTSHYGCLYSSITAHGDIYCGGYLSCDGSTISIMNRTTSIFLTGSHSGSNMNVICGASSLCKVVCIGYDSCSSVTLQCIGHCEVDCNAESGCPPTNGLFVCYLEKYENIICKK